MSRLSEINERRRASQKGYADIAFVMPTPPGLPYYTTPGYSPNTYFSVHDIFQELRHMRNTHFGTRDVEDLLELLSGAAAK